MKKTLIIISLISVAILTHSCRSNHENESPEASNTNPFIGDWEISKYIFIDNQNGAQIGSVNPECSGKNLYQFKQNDFLNIKMYKDFYNGPCLDNPRNDSGSWIYNENTKMLNFYGDAEYKVKSISSTQLEIDNFDEGYVDYRPNIVTPENRTVSLVEKKQLNLQYVTAKKIQFRIQI